jgi:hypothetical protein
MEPSRPHMAIWLMCFGCWILKATNTLSEYVIWLMCFGCWILKATNTLSEYVICIAFALQQW